MSERTRESIVTCVKVEGSVLSEKDGLRGKALAFKLRKFSTAPRPWEYGLYSERRVTTGWRASFVVPMLQDRMCPQEPTVRKIETCKLLDILMVGYSTGLSAAVFRLRADYRL